MKRKKVMGMIAALSLTAVIGVGGTLAYLSAQTEQVKNTFTIGTGYIDDGDHTGIFIDEENVDPDPEDKNPPARDTENVYKEMVPDKTYTKDPLVHMVGGSIESYVFVRVDGLGELKKENINVYYYDEEGVLQQGVDPSDYLDLGADENGDGLYLYIGGKYAYKSETSGKIVENVVDVSGQAEKSDCPLANVFDVVMMDGDIGSEEFSKVTLKGKEITVKAAAVQYSEKMADYKDAMSTLPADWTK